MSNSQQDRKSIVFYRSFYDSIRELPDDAQLIIYRAIMEYSFDFKEEMDLSGLPKAIFILIKPLLDSNLAKYKAGIENGYKGADSGKKGGRPSKKPSTDENKNPQETLIKPSNVDVDVDVDVDYNEDKEREGEIITRTPDFFQFSFSKTQFEHLPKEFQRQTDKENWVKWQNLNEHIDRNLKEIRKIEQQMNHKEYLNFKEKYIGKNKLALNTVLKLLENFNNHRQAAQKYLAVYPALCKWADIELSQKQSSVVNQ